MKEGGRTKKKSLLYHIKSRKRGLNQLAKRREGKGERVSP